MPSSKAIPKRPGNFYRSCTTNCVGWRRRKWCRNRLAIPSSHLRLVEHAAAQPWNSRGHFFGAAAEAMRRILVENARRKKALRRGGNRQKVDLDVAEPAAPRLSDDLLALDEALNKLADKDRPKAELVKLRYFAGLTMVQTAAALGISLATAHRWWNYARAWLHQEMSGNEGSVS